MIYKADYVPVGKDQEQHLELSRNIAARFNYQFDKEYFVHPEPLFTEIPKLLSPADPTRKMSKSLGEKHYINLFSDPKKIEKQIKSAVTDTGTEGVGEMSAGVKNLFELLRACGKQAIHDDFMVKYKDGIRRYGDLKAAVATALIELTTPFRESLAELQADEKNVKAQIQESSAKIRTVAQQTIREVRSLTGLFSL